MKKILTLVIMFTLIGCTKPARMLVDTQIGMNKKEVKNILGYPEGVALSFKTPDGKLIEVWNYRLAQYEMATTMSPYFDIYGLFFENGKLIKIKKIQDNARLSENGALKMLGYPDIRIDIKHR